MMTMILSPATHIHFMYAKRSRQSQNIIHFCTFPSYTCLFTSTWLKIVEFQVIMWLYPNSIRKLKYKEYNINHNRNVSKCSMYIGSLREELIPLFFHYKKSFRYIKDKYDNAPLYNI